MEENVKEVKDFFSEFKNRVTSPLFGSFVISWLLFNWKVPITLIFYSRQDLYYDIKVSFIDAIKEYCNLFDSLIFPFVTALFYTFGYPYIRNLIKIFQASRILEVDSAILKKSVEKGSVSIARYQVLNEQLRTKMSQLQRFYDEQTQIEQDNATLILKNTELEEKIKQFENAVANHDVQLEELRNSNRALQLNLHDYQMQVTDLTNYKLTNEESNGKINALMGAIAEYENFVDEIDKWALNINLGENLYKSDEVIRELRAKIAGRNKS